MASIKNLKKDLDYMIYDIVEELYDIQLMDSSKTKVSDALIDEASDFREQTISQIRKAKGKKEFSPIIKGIEDKADYFIKKLSEI